MEVRDVLNATPGEEEQVMIIRATDTAIVDAVLKALREHDVGGPSVRASIIYMVVRDLTRQRETEPPEHKWRVGDVVTARSGNGVHLWLITELLPGGKYSTSYVSRHIGWDTAGITLSEERDGPLLSKVAHLS